jgi:predicted ferric reductase
VDKTAGLEASTEEMPGTSGKPGTSGPSTGPVGPVGPVLPGRQRAWLLIGFYGAAVAAPPVLAMLSGLANNGENPLYKAGRCCALSAFMILCLQVVLAGRFALVERPFGLDVLVRFHRRMALVAGVLLLCHPLLLALGGAGFDILTSLNLPWYIWVGKAALTLLLVNLLVSLYQKRLALGFERWRVLHDLLGPALVSLAFTHSWFIEEGFAHASPHPLWPQLAVFTIAALAWLWPLLACSALALMAWHRLMRPLLLARRPYTVTAVRQEAPGVWTLELAPPGRPGGSARAEGPVRPDSARADRPGAPAGPAGQESPGPEVFKYLPGQFQFLTLKRGRGLPAEEHHFTISSSPARAGFVSSTIKESGDFTATIGRTEPGDTVVVQAPFGRFSYLVHSEDTDLVFLAGGIGVTPLMSMLRHMRDTDSAMPVTFIYANRTQADIVFGRELADIEAGGRPRLKLVHVLSRPEPGWQGEQGRMDEAMIRRVCGDLTGKSFYLCGPPGLVTAGLQTLKRLGVPAGRIRREFFSFLEGNG